MYLRDGPPAPKKSIAKGEDEIDFPQPPSMFSDPGQMDAMMGQFKTQTVVMIPQMVIMAWVNFFFSGFVASECLLLFSLSLSLSRRFWTGLFINEQLSCRFR